MKQKLYYLFLTALFGLFGMNVWAQDLTTRIIDGKEYNEIGNADDLVIFAQIVNGGDYSANAVLTDDIDMTDADISVFPIGGPDAGIRYIGNFDGQGHKISNFKLINPSAATNFGMFNTNTGVVLKNFWLDSTCEIKGTQVVSLIGRHDGGGTFEGIGNCANVTGTNNNVGGLFGAVMGNSNDKKNVTIKNCWTTGKITSTNTSASNYKDCGALSGWFNNAKVTITNFWTVAEVVNYKSESTYIIRSGGGVSFTNCSGCYSKYKADSQEKVSFTTITEDVKNGELCYMLNGDQTTITWYQTIGTDETPVPFAAGHDQVYANGSFNCDMTPKEGSSIVYSNTNASIIDEHQYDGDYCSVCGYLKQDSEGYFEISNPANLAWFATHVNDVNHSAKAKLLADLDMTDVEVAVIGNNPTNSYKGTFDGQGHKISNYSLTIDGTFVAGYGYGMFGNTSGATIKNFTIDGNITLTGSGSGDFGGALVGWPDGGTLIQNIKSNVNIDAKVYSHMGGIAGSLRTATIDQCEFAGTLNGNASGNGASGIAGYTNNGTITNCIFSGTVEGTGTGYFAGILGYVNSGAVTIQNCLSYGQINNTNSQYSAALVARLRNIGTFSNTYYTSGKSIGGGEKAADETIVANATKITDEQLANGEVCYLLNGDQSDIVFFQTLPDDIVPTLDDTHGTVYAAGTTCPNGHPQGVSYSNTPGGAVIVRPHVFADGFCTYCEAVDEDYLVPNGDNFFEIGTPTQLKWFAFYANQVEPASNAVLTSDIDLTDVEWTPIGIASMAYAGTFDGQGYGITNFEGTTDAAVGKNGLFWATSSTISNIYSTLVIEAGGNGAKHVGGIVGSAQSGANTITNCTFAGSLTIGSGSHDCFAGIAGYISSDVIMNCANYGTVDYYTESGYVGGIVGYINNANPTIANCLSVGAVTYKGEGTASYGGAIIGRHRKDAAKVQNNYWLEGCATAASSDVVLTAPAATEVTDEQLASGEIAYKLGTVFRQNIGSDATPVLDVTHGIVNEITEVGYATMYIPGTSVEIPAGVEAFTGTIEGNMLLLHSLQNVITKGQAVVLKGAAGYYSFMPTEAGLGLIQSDLVGADEDVEAAEKYILAKPEGGEVGFYKATGTIKAGKAYLVGNATGPLVKAFLFAEDDATGIESIQNSNSNIQNEDAIYNLAGQRIQMMQKGINIVNGKKVLK